jgi:hypothetical protein
MTHGYVITFCGAGISKTQPEVQYKSGIKSITGYILYRNDKTGFGGNQLRYEPLMADREIGQMNC